MGRGKERIWGRHKARKGQGNRAGVWSGSNGMRSGYGVILPEWYRIRMPPHDAR